MYISRLSAAARVFSSSTARSTMVLIGLVLLQLGVGNCRCVEGHVWYVAASSVFGNEDGGHHHGHAPAPEHRFSDAHDCGCCGQADTSFLGNRSRLFDSNSETDLVALDFNGLIGSFTLTSDDFRPSSDLFLCANPIVARADARAALGVYRL